MKVDEREIEAVYVRDMRQKPIYRPRRKISRTTICASGIGALIGLMLIALSTSGIISYAALWWIIGLVGLAIAVYVLRGRRTW